MYGGKPHVYGVNTTERKTDKEEGGQRAVGRQGDMQTLCYSGVRF